MCDCCVMLTNQSKININYGNRAYLRLGCCRYVFHDCRCGHHQLFPFYDLQRLSDLMEEWILIAVNSWLSSASVGLSKVFWGAVIVKYVYLYTVPVTVINASCILFTVRWCESYKAEMSLLFIHSDEIKKKNKIMLSVLHLLNPSSTPGDML